MPALFDRIWLGADQTTVGSTERPGVWTLDDPPWEFKAFLTTAGADNRVNDIQYFSANLVVACGDSGVGAGQVWVSTDLGSTWTETPMDIYPGEVAAQPARFYRVDESNYIFMVANTGGGNAGMYLVHWDGASTFTYIKRISTTAYYGTHHNGIDGIGDEYIMAMNGGWNEYSYWDGGSLTNPADWHDGTHALGSFVTGRVYAVSATEIYCCGDNFWPAQGIIYRWTGAGWSYFGVNWGTPNTFSTNRAGGVYKDPDSGLVWAAGRRYVNGTEYIDVQTCDAAGSSWQFVARLGAAATYGDVTDLAKFEDEIVISGFISTGTGYVWRSRDEGASWTLYHGATAPPGGWKRCNALDISAPDTGGHTMPKSLMPGGDIDPRIAVAERERWRRRRQR